METAPTRWIRWRLAVVLVCTLVGTHLATVSAARENLPEACREPLPLPSTFAFAKDQYERLLGKFFQAECYVHLDWPHDRQLRVTGPTVAALVKDGHDPHLSRWQATTWGLHNTVLIYYAPDVYRWLCETDAAGDRQWVQTCQTTCPTCQLQPGAKVKPIADGAMIVKLMYGFTTEALLETPSTTKPKLEGIALMVKDQHGSKDGWWWGAWAPDVSPEDQLDWPPPVNFPYPWMGFGYYCVNCHASANNNEFTYSDLSHIHGDPNTFTTFYFQDMPPILGSDKGALPTALQHLQVYTDSPRSQVERVSQPLPEYDRDFLRDFGAEAITKLTWKDLPQMAMPPEPYDHVVAAPQGPEQYLTSDQCVGCHAAGSTGMHFDMTAQSPDQPAFSNLINLAPYGEWRSSPMGLAGRDPIFLAQLETEEKLHSALGDVIQDLCLHCHGVMGQRQFCRDQFDPARADEVCSNTGLLGLDAHARPIVQRKLFSRDILDAIPYQATPEQQRVAKYGALARDGISCTVCHHIQIDPNTPFGHTFTGDFQVGAADQIYGPFQDPKAIPMQQALGLTPVHDTNIRSSKICGSCHSVVLPVFDGNEPYIKPGSTEPEIIIEQATYPEWVFSDFRDDGATPQSCQDCHMPKTYEGLDGELAFKIASIQEASNMPEAENRRPKSEIDLQPRAGFARHTLVGLNVFFNKLAQQFPDVLGIRTQDPMLVSHGVAPLATTYASMIRNASDRTATIAITEIEKTSEAIVANVEVENLVGHKFPSGVGFRRAFIEFAVLDNAGNTLWMSGRTTPTGILVEAHGQPIKGELFWKPNCEPMSAQEQKGFYQPHYRTITRQEQVQIYQELVTDPRGKLTTSFLALAKSVKDNRLLPRGWNPSVALATQAQLGSPKLSAEALVHHVQSILPDAAGGTVDDPYYKPISQGGLGGGGDTLTYRVALRDLSGAGAPAQVRARLFYQAIPPFYLQDRFCTTPEKRDTARLFFMTGHLNLQHTRAEDWKLEVVSSGTVAIP